MKELMLGNKAAARGLYEAGCVFASSYPGTPSTEITEEAAKFDEVYCEWAPNEKVALEAAIGASIGGARSFCAMKHVGLNVAADPLFTASYTGVNGGMLIAVADDPGMHSSQNEQDSRHYAMAAKLPMLEPSDSGECLRFSREAFALSEQFDTPVLLRLSTRVSHSQSVVEVSARVERPLKEYVKDPHKYVMMPGNARGRHAAVEKRMEALRAYAETCPFNTVEKGDGGAVGVITSGVAYQYAKEALPKAGFLKLGLAWPLPSELIIRFAREYKTVYVIEELDPFIETHCRSLGLTVRGKEDLTLLGEYSQGYLKEKITGETPEFDALEEEIPVRPPAMCPGCPHRGVFYTLSRLGLTVFGDIGCYTLGAASPLCAMDTTICMGASVSGLHGFNKVRGEAARSVAVIGDSTFMHSGVTGLINITYNMGVSTVVILDNSITGMTGHQQNPTTGLTLKNQPTYAISLERICEGAGVSRIRVVDPNDLDQLKAILIEETAANEPSVIITRRPCVLLKHVPKKPPLAVDAGTCVGCKKCLDIGCPAISLSGGKSRIDGTLCVGCGLCVRLCRPGAIKEPIKEAKA